MVKLNNPTWIFEKNTQKLIATLGADNMRFVGGCVRNHLLEMHTDDIDIATILEPEAVIKKLSESGIKVIPTGLDHGTVTAIIEKNHYEITTLRTDIECHGRHAEVAYINCWEEDAKRRDFTINALYADMDGNITDYFGGIDDIKQGLIRFIGNPEERIKEDGLRILRFFRFYAYYGKTKPVDADIAAIFKLKQCVSELSGERIQAEMFKLLAADNMLSVFLEMHELGVLAEIELDIKSLSLPNDLPKTKPIVFLASVIEKNSANKLVERWKLSNKNKKLLLFLTSNNIPKNADNLTLKKAIRSNGKSQFMDLCFVSYASGEISNTEYQNAINLAENWDIPEFPIKANDLMQVGFEEGKKLGQTLKALEIKWENSDYKMSKKELLKTL